MNREKLQIYLGKVSGILVICLGGILLYIANAYSSIDTGIFIQNLTLILFYLAIISASIKAIFEFSIAFSINVKVRKLFSSFKKKNNTSPPGTVWLKIVSLFYSKKNKNQVFEPIVVDWQEEYFEALYNKEIWKSRWINVRYTYAFVVAMWQKSPIGDLIEFVRKLATQ